MSKCQSLKTNYSKISIKAWMTCSLFYCFWQTFIFRELKLKRIVNIGIQYKLILNNIVDFILKE